MLNQFIILTIQVNMGDMKISQTGQGYSFIIYKKLPMSRHLFKEPRMSEMSKISWLLVLYDNKQILVL